MWDLNLFLKETVIKIPQLHVLLKTIIKQNDCLNDHKMIDWGAGMARW